jgi:hypothetical protein
MSLRRENTMERHFVLCEVGTKFVHVIKWISVFKRKSPATRARAWASPCGFVVDKSPRRQGLPLSVSFQHFSCCLLIFFFETAWKWAYFVTKFKSSELFTDYLCMTISSLDKHTQFNAHSDDSIRFFILPYEESKDFYKNVHNFMKSLHTI